jgi:V8-like Glu-specific endopeptidase
MSSISRRPARRRAALAATAVTAVLTLTATACNGDDSTDNAQPSENAPGPDQKELDELLDNLPFEVDIDAWKAGGWKNWDKDTWLREVGDFINPIIEGLWDEERMGEAEEPEQSIDDDEIEEDDSAPETDDPADDRGLTDPEPAPVQAEAVPTPYTDHAAPIGKVFFDTPEGTMVCSGTVVKDPNAPGKSNLVATAGHCIHGGAEGGWFRNVMFVPSYNNDGLAPAELENAPFEKHAPYGLFWANYVSTTEYWIDNGAAVGGDGAHGDFAIMAVEPEDGGSQSLEEAVGNAVDVNFDAPAVSGLGSTTLYGFPAADPYNGVLMYRCTDVPGRLALDTDMPVMYRAGCTMTGGSSGGPWLRDGDSGEPELVSVNSIGPFESTWLAGTRRSLAGIIMPADPRPNGGSYLQGFAPSVEFRDEARVTAVRAQITETLRQFDTVNNVVISVEGRTEDVLQP